MIMPAKDKDNYPRTIRPQFLDKSPQTLDNSPPSCEENNCWSLTFRELVAPKGAVVVCVCLSLLKSNLFERGENRLPEALLNSFDSPHTASRD